MNGGPELWERQGSGGAGEDFLLLYQRAVLLALQRQDFLDQTQLERCLEQLKRDADQ